MAVSRNSKIQVLYSDIAGITPGDADLFNGEFAWAYGEKELYIGGGNSTDVTFVGAEILRSGDTPFASSPSTDNKLATTKAIYDYVDGQIGSAAGVTTVEGVTGAVNLQSADAFLTISAGTHPDKSITFDIVTDDVTIGLTASTKLGLLSNSVGGVHIQDNAVALGTKTTGDYVASLVEGNLIGLTDNSGEGATPTISVDLSELTDMTDAAVGTDELVILDAGSQKRKAINEITIGLFNTANQIALGTDTTGNYVGSVIAGTNTGISVGGIVGENMTASITLKNYASLTNNTVMIWDDGNGQLSDAPMTTDGTGNMTVTNDLTVGGDLTVNGSLTTLDVVNVKVEDPMIFLGATTGSPSNFDIGFVGLHGGNTYTGLLRDADDGVFYLFDTSENLETATNFTPGSAVVSELRAHIVAGTFS